MSQDAPSVVASARAAVLDALLRLAGGLPDPLPPSPMPLLNLWLEEAVRAGRVPNPNAVVIASVGPDGRPSARVVLCRGIDVHAGTLTFYTNYRSRKGVEIEANPRLAGVFHWDESGRQARVEGDAQRTSEAESDAYFASRATLSKVAAWASEQSRPLKSRSELVERVLETAGRFGVGVTDLLRDGSKVHVPRPPHWGGFRVTLRRVELWIGGSGRLHDRAEWLRRDDAGWDARRLNP